jgi:prefoldin subunit 5
LRLGKGSAMIERLEMVIADLEERIDELEDMGANESEIAPLRERLRTYESMAEEEEMGHWFSTTTHEA